MAAVSNKTLILLTNNYPFGRKNEVYIDNEIKDLSSAFKRVIIIPEHFTRNSRVDIKNVEALDINKRVVFSKWLIFKYFRTIIESLILESKNENSGGIFYNFKKVFNALAYSDAIQKYLIEEKLKEGDVVFYSYWFYHWSLVSSYIKKKSPNCKAISRAHLNDLYVEFNKDQFTEFKLKYLDFVYPISQHGTNYLQNKYPAYCSRIRTHYLGISDLGINKVNYNPNIFVVVSCSTIRKDKRLEKIVDVLKYVKFNTTWVHFGTGPMMEEIKELCQQLPKNVTVDFKGYVLNHLVKEYYLNNQINLFLNFSSAEGIPVSVMEAISFGIPVLATAVYGTPEAVPESVGVLIDLDFDAQEVANQIDAFKMSHRNTNSFRQSVRMHWEQNFDAKRTYKKFVTELKEFN